jgi:hypothetical protein
VIKSIVSGIVKDFPNMNIQRKWVTKKKTQKTKKKQVLENKIKTIESFKVMEVEEKKEENTFEEENDDEKDVIYSENNLDINELEELKELEESENDNLDINELEEEEEERMNKIESIMNNIQTELTKFTILGMKKTPKKKDTNYYPKRQAKSPINARIISSNGSTERKY